jgi:hypothetical protein
MNDLKSKIENVVSQKGSIPLTKDGIVRKTGLKLIKMFLPKPILFIVELIFGKLDGPAEDKTDKGFAWIVLTVASIILTIILGYSLFVTSPPNVNPVFFWIGIVILIANSLALIKIVTK